MIVSDDLFVDIRQGELTLTSGGRSVVIAISGGSAGAFRDGPVPFPRLLRAYLEPALAQFAVTDLPGVPPGSPLAVGAGQTGETLRTEGWSADRTPLPTWQCHKRVRAAKIDAINCNVVDASWTLYFAHDAGENMAVLVDAAFMTKHTPQVGGYYVVYEDGYTSYSPPGPFESGYVQIKEE